MNAKLNDLNNYEDWINKLRDETSQQISMYNL